MASNFRILYTIDFVNPVQIGSLSGSVTIFKSIGHSFTERLKTTEIIATTYLAEILIESKKKLPDLAIFLLNFFPGNVNKRLLW